MSKHVIVDLEMCKVPKPMRSKRFHWGSETIQIGAVLVNEELEIIDEFCIYVHPQFGSIDGYIRNLTGITSYDVKDACEMKEALEQFVDWIPKDRCAIHELCLAMDKSSHEKIYKQLQASEDP